jgi:murein DD-endopeptidase MepM/ murein hydrolase activator NlpD
LALGRVVLLGKQDKRDDKTLKARLYQKFNAAFSKHLPEQRVFFKSDSGTRFIRLRPLQSAVMLGSAGLLLCWTVVVTAIFLMDTISSGTAREEAQRERAIYEARLNALSTERDVRAEEAMKAQERFYIALEQVSKMQSALLASEDDRKELTAGIDVIQSTLRRTMKDRDAARSETAELVAQLQEGEDEQAPVIAKAKSLNGSVGFLTAALEATAVERDELAQAAKDAEVIADDLRFALEINEQRNEEIFTRLEEAVTVSLEPLDKMFRAAGMPTDSILQEVRRGYSGQGGGPLLPVSMSTSGGKAIPDASTSRANGLLRELDRINLFRIAADKTPVAMPVKAAFRFTSPFGYRNDPKGAGRRMHAGVDFAGAKGTPIYATADGVVTHAGWQSGYGKLVKIRHAFGIETRYAHNSRIRVKVGQKVSRGDRIGDMGATGRVTGTHLHYEVRINGTPVNPMTYIKAGRDVF